MSEEKAYLTGLVACDWDWPSRHLQGRGWRAETRATVKSRAVRQRIGRRTRSGQEVILFARSWRRAQCALDLIVAALVLIDGPLLDWEAWPIARGDGEPPDWLERGAATLGMLHLPCIPRACGMAARASSRHSRTYALAKYAVSMQLFGVHGIDMDPSHARHMVVPCRPGGQVRLACALEIAYSIMEDLGLEIRARKDLPSRIGGEWNPPVRDDLLNRLRKAGVLTERPFHWMVRGPKTAVEAKRATPGGSREPWTYSVMVRDREIPLVDAILHADWLRDRVAAHAANRLTRSLSPYDVVNVQMLARSLLLDVLAHPHVRLGR
jgi:hypothetical protein